MSAKSNFETGLFSVAAEQFHRLRVSYPGHQRAPDALYYEAESLLAMGHEERAIDQFERFDELYPDHPFAFGTRLSLGKYFFETGDYRRAIATLAEVVEESPTPAQSAKGLYWMGESAVRLDRTEEAFEYFNRILSDFPATDTAPRAAYAIAFNQVRDEQFDQAARSFEMLANRFPQSEYARNIGLALAEVYYEIDDFSRAAAEIERQLPNLTGAARDRAIFLLAESYNQLRDSERAILNYRHFTEGATDNLYYRRALYGLGWNYYHEGTWQWAADNFRLVRQSGDDDLAAESMYYEAVNLGKAQQDQDAIEAYRRYLSRYPEHELADHGWFELGVTLYQQRLWREASEAFSAVVDHFPASDLRGDALLNLGNSRIALGAFDDALKAFDKAIQLDAAPESLRQDVVFQKAWLLYRNRRYDESAPEFMDLYSSDPSAERAEEALFWAAESFFQIEQYARAETLFQRYVDEHPGARHVEAAHYALGWTHFRQGEYAQAVPEFELFLDSYREDSGTVPYRADAQLRLADSYFALKQYTNAVRVYQRMAARGDDYALYQIGQAYSNAGDAFEAISTFRDLLQRYPASEWREEAQYQLGYLYFLNQDYEQAIAAYTELIDSYPLDPLAAKAQYGIGDANFNAGNIEAAVQSYENVLQNYPASPFTADAAAGIQYALMADGQQDRADTIVDSLIAALPESDTARELRFRQAEAKYQSGLTEEALADFQTFLRNASAGKLHSEALYYVAAINEQIDQPDLARDFYARLLSEYPESSRFASAGIALGNLLLGSEEHEEALRVFRETADGARTNTRSRTLALYGQSLALRELGRSEEAEELLLTAVNDTGDGQVVDHATRSPAYLGLAKISLARGDTTTALGHLEQVVRNSRDETGAEALHMLGSIQLHRGRPAEAVETLGRMSVLFAGYPEWMSRSYFAQARAFERLEDFGEAVRAYELILSDYPESSVADDAKARLEELR